MYLLLAFTCIQCASSVQENIDHLNGYWEISRIETEGGFEKNYGMSQNIEYIEIDPATYKGVRTKVKPNALGEFTSTAKGESISLTTEDNTVILTYSTAMDTWKEEVIELTKNKLITSNEKGLVYHYKRYEPIVKSKP